MRLQNKSFADQQVDKMQLSTHRKKYNLDAVVTRYKVMYQFQEYLKILNQTSENISKSWYQIVSKIPSSFQNEAAADCDSKGSENTIDLAENRARDDSSSTSKKTDAKIEKKDSSYKLPLIGGWKSKQFSSEGTEKKNTAPKWKTDVTITSSVSIW